MNERPIKKLARAACERLGITSEAFYSRGRKPMAVLARYAVAYVAYETKGFTYQQIGRDLGGRSHGTMIHGIGRIKEWMKTEQDVRELISYLIKSLTKN